jgi:protein TonB
MSPAVARMLPRTRAFRRHGARTIWWIAAGIAVLVNLGLVVVLSQISHLHTPAPAAPLTVRTIRQVEPEPPPPPPQARETPPEPVDEPLALVLPDLALPTTSTPGALTLPDVPNLDGVFDLPLAVPAFAALAPVSAPAGPAAPVALGDPDQPAEQESAFDLERFYPRSARVRGVTGRSRLRLTIDASGTVTTVLVSDCTPPGVFEQATERLGRSLRYRPARRDGKPVASTKDLIIDWTLK